MREAARLEIKLLTLKLHDTSYILSAHFLATPHNMHRRSISVVVFAVLLRLFLFTAFPALPDLLTNRVEISTPVTSFKRLKEGLFLYTHGVSPYDGGIFHQAPLLLAFFSSIPSSPIVTNLIYILADVLSALALIRIAASRVAVKTPNRLTPSHDGR